MPPGATDGRHGAPVQGCASPFPSEFLMQWRRCHPRGQTCSPPGQPRQPAGAGRLFPHQSPKPLPHCPRLLSSCWLEASDMISKQWSSPQSAGPVGQPFANTVSIGACVEQGAAGCRAAPPAPACIPLGWVRKTALKHRHATANLCGGINIFSSVFSLCLIIRKILLAFPAAAEQ